MRPRIKAVFFAPEQLHYLFRVLGLTGFDRGVSLFRKLFALGFQGCQFVAFCIKINGLRALNGDGFFIQTHAWWRWFLAFFWRAHRTTVAPYGAIAGNIFKRVAAIKVGLGLFNQTIDHPQIAGDGIDALFLGRAASGEAEEKQGYTFHNGTFGLR